MTQDPRLSAAELTELAEAVFRRGGLDEERARKAARPVVEAELMGIGTHGAARLLIYGKRLVQGTIDPKAQIGVERRGASMALVDGANGLGPLVAALALEEALSLAAESGLAFVGCRRSNHLGALAPYAFQACETGYLLIAGSNASPMMAPWGGAQARIGNNPIALGAPGGGAPHMILDIAMSQAAKSKIRAAAAKGEAIPEGWAADSQGLPTTDPAAALTGFLLPIGGHKGSGLALAVDILCGVLTGSGFLTDLVSGTDSPDQQSNLGHFFLALDPTRLIGREAYEDSMARFHGIVAGTPPAEGVTAVTLPGERMQARRRRALEEGVTLPRDLHEGLLALAG